MMTLIWKNRKGEKMNKQLEKKIEKLEELKSKAVEKRNNINDIINGYDNELKILYDYKKQQEKIYQMQQELDIKIQEK